jgi:hypothetical protein
MFYAALCRTQHWLRHSPEAIRATLPLMETEVIPEMKQQAQELLRQMKPTVEAHDTTGAISALINKVLTDQDMKEGGAEEMLRVLEQSLKEDTKEFKFETSESY